MSKAHKCASRVRPDAGLPSNPYAEDRSRFLLRLHAFVEREGHARVPQRFVDETGYRLGLAVSRRRQTRGAIPDMDQTLEAISGWTWSMHTSLQEFADKWCSFHAVHGQRPRPSGGGLEGKLASRAVTIRRNIAAGKLAPEDVALMRGLPCWDSAHPKGPRAGASRARCATAAKSAMAATFTKSIRQTLTAIGSSPTTTNSAAAHVGVGTNAMHGRIIRVIREGLIERVPNTSPIMYRRTPAGDAWLAERSQEQAAK